MDRGLLTPQQVAKLLKVATRSLWRMAKQDGFPQPIRFSRKTIRWKASEVQAYIDAHQASGGACPPLLYVFALCTAIDGDTLRCGDERVRLARIDSAKRGEPGFQETKDTMQVLIQRKQVRCYVPTREKYGRRLGECFTAETPSLSDAMLERGLAESYRRER